MACRRMPVVSVPIVVIIIGLRGLVVLVIGVRIALLMMAVTLIIVALLWVP